MMRQKLQLWILKKQNQKIGLLAAISLIVGNKSVNFTRVDFVLRGYSNNIQITEKEMRGP